MRELPFTPSAYLKIVLSSMFYDETKKMS